MTNGYIGSSSLQTSTANYEVVPNGDPTWTNPRYIFYSFSFMNDQDCHVSINGGSPIYLRAGQGFNTEHPNAPIDSFIVNETGVSFNFIGSW